MKIIRTKLAALNIGYDKELKSQLVQHLNILIKQIEEGSIELAETADALGDLAEGTAQDAGAEQKVRTEQPDIPVGVA